MATNSKHFITGLLTTLIKLFDLSKLNNREAIKLMRG